MYSSYIEKFAGLKYRAYELKELESCTAERLGIPSEKCIVRQFCHLEHHRDTQI